MRWYLFGPVIALNIVVGAGFVLKFDPYLGIFQLCLAGVLVVISMTMRVEPPSRTRKAAEYELDLTMGEAAQKAFDALRSIGAEVGQFSVDKGELEARTKFSWRSFGEIVRVKIFPISEDRTKICIESDTVQPNVLTDWGANKRNLRRFQNVLFGIGR